MKLLYPDWPAPPQIKAFTTLRDDNLNLAQDSVIGIKNRMHLLEDKLIPSPPFWLSQVHEATVLEFNKNLTKPKADASYSFKPKEVCVVLTADCLPILLTDHHGSFVAAIHAGWRGLAQNIITHTLSKINRPSRDILAWLGPAIGPSVYQVGKEVHDYFIKLDTNTQKAFELDGSEKWLCNLYTIAKLELNKNNVTHIYGGEHCTYTQPNVFFSYRRDGKNAGRMGSFIWRD